MLNNLHRSYNSGSMLLSHYVTNFLFLVTTGGGWPAHLGLNFSVSGAHWIVMVNFKTYKLFLLLLWVRKPVFLNRSLFPSKIVKSCGPALMSVSLRLYPSLLSSLYCGICHCVRSEKIIRYFVHNNNEKVEFHGNILLIFYKAVEMGLLQLLSLPDQDSSCPGRFWRGCKHSTQQPSWADAPLQSVRDVPVLPSLTESCLSGSKDR